MPTQEERIVETLRTLIIWIAQSSVGVITPRDASILLDILSGPKEEKK